MAKLTSKPARGLFLITKCKCTSAVVVVVVIVVVVSVVL